MTANSGKKVLIIAGPNGAGKTTFARSFLPEEANVPRFINADLIAAGLMLPRYLRMDVRPAPAARSRRSAAPGWGLPTPKGSRG